MGQILSEPVTTKESAYCQNSDMMVGSSCMQGWRISMEDAHTHILSLSEDPQASFFGVYDGHGGAKIAQYAGKHLHKFVVKQPKYTEGKYEKALKQAFLDIDTAMLNDKSLKDEFSGSTAIVCLLKANQLYVANVGDSRAIACVNGKVDVLSIDHKPSNEAELKRITAAGGWVEFNRVNGNLALSRALGDFLLKRNEEKMPEEQVITGEFIQWSL
ncbi:hypothetical protein RUM44_007795 [Polyplax serrata]|uniref:protein-serine/threonine phosphatase n=1 Tax=Polyplax serrata TaxID=468196 RepID=A0ABR1BAI6_POLSC